MDAGSGPVQTMNRVENGRSVKSGWYLQVFSVHQNSEVFSDLAWTSFPDRVSVVKYFAVRTGMNFTFANTLKNIHTLRA